MDLMSREQYGEITAFYALSLPEFHMSAHSHKSFEIMYVTAGSCTIFCGGGKYQALANHFVFVGSQIPHRLEIQSDHPCAILNLEFHFSSRKGLLNLSELLEKSGDFSSFWKKRPSCFYGGDMRNLGYSLKDLIPHLKKSPDSADFLFYLLFARVMEELAFSVMHPRENTGLRYLKKACEYIDANLHETIRIPKVAAYAGINKSYLQSLFARLLGCGIIEYVNKKRMEEAEFLLANSSMSITDIAFSTGYNSRQHFAHTFEKYCGTGPLAYRKLHARKLEADTGNAQYILEENQNFSRKSMD